MHFSNVAAGLGGIFGLIVLIAAALAVARANFAKAQIEALRGDRDDLDARSKRQAEEILELQADLKAEKVARLALEKVVTGRELMEDLKTELNSHHLAAMAGQKTLLDTMNDVDGVLNAIKVKVGA